MSDTSELIPRYVWRSAPEPGYEYDEYSSFINDECWDRLTGKRVICYDLGDPANWNRDYGGWSQREWMEKKKLDPNEKIESKYNVLLKWPRVEGDL